MHVYASLADAKRYASDEGIAWGEGSTNDALALSILESLSRHVDGWARRSRMFGSGFGPRLGTNRYDAKGGTELDLRDDLLDTDTVTLLASTASTDTSAIVEDTDFFLVNQGGGYEPAPYRKAVLHGLGDTTHFPTGLRVIEWAGKWGHQDVRRTLTATLDAALNASATTVAVTDLDELSPGMTLLVGSEQMYVVTLIPDAMGDTITVDRGVNGTTAASHLDEAALERYVYDPRVVDATLRLWGRRWAARNAGADGTDGGGSAGIVTPRESEDTILRRTLGDLKLMGPVVVGRPA